MLPAAVVPERIKGRGGFLTALPAGRCCMCLRAHGRCVCTCTCGCTPSPWGIVAALRCRDRTGLAPSAAAQGAQAAPALPRLCLGGANPSSVWFAAFFALRPPVCTLMPSATCHVRVGVTRNRTFLGSLGREHPAAGCSLLVTAHSSMFFTSAWCCSCHQ